MQSVVGNEDPDRTLNMVKRAEAGMTALVLTVRVKTVRVQTVYPPYISILQLVSETRFNSVDGGWPIARRGREKVRILRQSAYVWLNKGWYVRAVQAQRTGIPLPATLGP